MIKIIMMGGIGEIGRNMTVLESEHEIIVIDCGVSFASGKQAYGAAYLVQDFFYLCQRAHKVKALILTHGHEDHMGNICLFHNNFPEAMIIGSPYSIELLYEKFSEHKWGNTKIKRAYPNQSITIGEFSVDFIHTNHSIPGAYMLAIKTSDGVVVHSGDFKIDNFSITNMEPVTDMRSLKAYGMSGVDLLLMESTNAEREGTSKSEVTVSQEFDRIFASPEVQHKRVVITLFATNVMRVSNILRKAEKYGRRVYLHGSSLRTTIKAAQNLELYDLDDSSFMNEIEMNYCNPGETVIITTGCQGEPGSGLQKMINSEPGAPISIGKEDVVIFSSSVIPGNEFQISKMKEKILRYGALVYDRESNPNIHASGHACKGELKLLVNSLSPKYVIPLHGEKKHLAANKDNISAVSPNAEILVPQLGDIFSLSKGNVSTEGYLRFKEKYVDSTRETLLSSSNISDRITMAKNGVIFISAVINSRKSTIFGDVYVDAASFAVTNELMESIRQLVKSSIVNNSARLNSGQMSLEQKVFNEIGSDISAYVFDTIGTTPLVIVKIFNLASLHGHKIIAADATGASDDNIFDKMMASLLEDEDKF